MRLPAVALAALVLGGCGGPYVGSAASALGWRWRQEPVVGASTPDLSPLVAHALEAWRYGRQAPSCAGADVCVTRGQRSHAMRVGSRCVAELALGPSAVAQPPEGVLRVVEHEVGHCFGLPHVDTPGSIMNRNPHTSAGVTDEDRAMLLRVGDLR